MEIHAAPQVVERVVVLGVIQDLADHLIAVPEKSQKFADLAKMHLVCSATVNVYCQNLTVPFIISELSKTRIH